MGFKTGVNHPRWKGGRTVTNKGYVFLYMPGHHRANSAGHVLEHIVVLENKLGRKITIKDGEVHHIDGNRGNNHPDNLELLTFEDHRRKHRMLRGKSGEPTFKRRKKKPLKPKGSDRIYASGKSDEIEVVPKNKLPKGYYYLKA